MLSGEDDGWLMLSTDASSAKSDAKTVVTYLGEQSSDVGYFGPSYLNFGNKMLSNGINRATSTLIWTDLILLNGWGLII